MNKYYCSRCGYKANYKSKFIRHLQRKNICSPIIENIKIEKIYNKYFNKSLINHPKSSQNHPKSSQIIPNHPKLPKNNYTCIYCNNNYKHNYHLTRHLKTCSEKEKRKEYDNLKELVDLLNSQLMDKDKQMKQEIIKKQDEINKLMKKNGIININNIQNNIKLLGYRDTDISHLTKADYKACLNRANFCVPQIIKNIHFNPKKPENHNIYISNIKNAYVSVYNGRKWNIADRNEFLEDIIEEKTNLLEDKLMEWEEKGENYPLLIKKFNRYLEKRDVKVVITKIKQEIKFILFNNRHIIL